MKRIVLFPLLLTLALALPATAAQRGRENLRELAVFPSVDLQIRLGIVFRGGRWVVTGNDSPEPQIAPLRRRLKSSPNNVEDLLLLGNLLKDSGDTNEAKQWFAATERLCRDQAEKRPRDGVVLTHLGAALNGLGRFEEAELQYRRAVAISSNRWACWFGLGTFLSGRSMKLLLPPELLGSIDFFSGYVPPRVLEYRPPPDALERAEAFNREAARCFDRAVALSSNSAGMYFQRAATQCFSEWTELLIRHIRTGDSLEGKTLREAFFSEAAIADFQRTAELDPKSYRVLAFAAYFESTCVLKRNPTLTFATLPDETRRSFQRTMNRLQELAGGPDKKVGAGACEMMGLLNMIAANQPAAKDNVRQAIVLDSTREQSWDMLIGLTLYNPAPGEVVALCETRLKQRKSARNHLLLAKALSLEKKWDPAITNALTAAKLNTNDVAAPLMLVALTVRRFGDQPNALAAAVKLLNYADEMIQKMPPDEKTRTRWRELRLNSAIVLGLGGKTVRAKEVAESVLKYYPEDQVAKEILHTLE